MGSSFEEVELLRPAVLQGRLLLTPIALFLESSILKTWDKFMTCGENGDPNPKCRGCATSRGKSDFRNINFVSKALVVSFDLSCSTISVEFESLVSQFKSDTVGVHARSTDFEFSALLASAS